VVVNPRRIGKVLAMKKFDVQIALEGVAEARKKWNTAKRDFDADLNKIMRTLLHEASANYMSPEEVARASGYKVAQVRSMMRLNGLNPRDGKRVLADSAAKALAENAELLGIPVHEMDLMSPLAYLPMGAQMRQELTDKTVARVTELPEDHVHTPECAINRPCTEDVGGLPPLVHGVNFWDDQIGCGTMDYLNGSVWVSGNLDNITCGKCRVVLVKE